MPKPRNIAVMAVIVCAALATLLAAQTAARPASPAPPVCFTDVTVKAGIRFEHFKGNSGGSTILEEAGPGVCVADFDGDGYQDIYFVNGRDRYDRGLAARNALYRNNGDGTFTDVTDKARVPGTAYGLGCTWGDYDNDGHPDLYVTQYGKNVLYHNSGDGTFIDATDKAEVSGLQFDTIFHTGATFFDYDRDGYADLYVGGYCNFRPNSKRYCSLGHSVMTSCRPVVYGGTTGILYHNERNGTFREVTKQAGMYNPDGFNLAVGAADYDNDGWPDLFVSNDGSEAYLFRNRHDGTFKNVGMESGMGLTADGDTMAGMSIALGDYDNDGYLDLVITDFQDIADHIWRNVKGQFEETSFTAGIGEATRSVLSFGAGFFDYDNDGWPDLFIANGHVYPEVELLGSNYHYKQPNMLFHNNGNGKFTDVSAASGEVFARASSGRGAAFLDYDNDGNMDVVVSNDGDRPVLMHNSGATGRNWIGFRLVGVKSNRDALNARVYVRAGGLTQMREIMAAGSYLSQSDLRAHFGLNARTMAEEVEVRWPAGEIQLFRNVRAGKYYTIAEGSHRLVPQALPRARTHK